MTMADATFLNPHPPEFDRFLHAAVGEDRNGYVVTVLSALARLGLDPWTETADLVALGREAAGTRLGLLLSRFRDVPTLGRDHGKVARDLSLLLPEGRPKLTLKKAGAAGWPLPARAIWAIIALALVLLQILFVGVSGSGQ